MTNRRRRRTRHGVALAGGPQRFGRITGRQPSGSGPGGRLGTYVVTDDQTSQTCTFSYADIVTEGFCTIRTGERVRFLTDPADPATPPTSSASASPTSRTTTSNPPAS